MDYCFTVVVFSAFIVILQQGMCFLARIMLPWFPTSACHAMCTKAVNMKQYQGYEGHFFFKLIKPKLLLAERLWNQHKKIPMRGDLDGTTSNARSLRNDYNRNRVVLISLPLTTNACTCKWS